MLVVPHNSVNKEKMEDFPKYSACLLWQQNKLIRSFLTLLPIEWSGVGFLFLSISIPRVSKFQFLPIIVISNSWSITYLPKKL